jgi:hypothetical protein
VLVTHPTSAAPRHLREVVVPRVARGAARASRDASAVRIVASPLVATGRDAAAVARAREGVRQLLGFLYSTPAYGPSLTLFGWQERGEALHRASREGRWDTLAAYVDDAMLDAFAPSAPYGALAAVLHSGYAGLAQRLCLPLPEDPADDAAVSAIVAELRR